MMLASCFGLLVATGIRASAALHVEDASAMVQEGLRAHQHASSNASLGLLQARARLLSGQAQAPSGSFPCQQYPQMCKPPFNCQTFNFFELANGLLQGLAASGQPMLRAWCAAPQYAPYVDMCLAQKDLVKAGHIQYQWSLDQKANVDELDGSYCFLEGHCTNEAVTNETTLEEANAMCDARYGHDGW